ncbi:MAG: pantoate--beta-alanine ligase [Gammaproteobacteria bacterium]
MIELSTRQELESELQRQRKQGKSMGLVPTMGNLHAGHMSLVATAMELCDVVVVTIFVNPLQFGPTEDLAAYPRTPEQDIQLLNHSGCEILFTPAVSEIYPTGLDAHCKVIVPGLTREFCGASRPGHFDGVTTVVAKLFNIIRPDMAFFGLKDYQQFLVISKMVADLAMNVELHAVETVREESGLALSSRNRYLSPEEKAYAARLFGMLSTTADSIRGGNRNYPALESNAAQQLDSQAVSLDYFAIRNAEDLRAADADTETIVILGAIRIGATRLIDNIQLRLNP